MSDRSRHPGPRQAGGLDRWRPALLLVALTAASVAADHAETLYFLGIERLDSGDADGAYRLFRRIPTAPEVDLERSSYRDIGYRRELIQLLVNEGTEGLDPTFNIGKMKQAVRARARTRMAEIHMDRGEHDQAIEHLQIANRDDKGYALAHCRLAQCHLRLGNAGAAINAAKEAYLLSPTLRMYRRTYATAVATEAERIEAAGEVGKAMLAYDFAFEIDPLNPTALANYGHFLYRTGTTGREDDGNGHPAIATYNRLKGVYLIEQGARLALGDLRIQLRAGRVFRAEGRPDRAVEFFDRAADAGDGPLEAAKGAAWALIELGECDDALLRLRPLVREHPRDVDLVVLMAEAYLRQGRVKDAEKQARAALKLGKDSPEALHIRGVCRLAEGDIRDAERVLRQAADAGADTRAGLRAQILLARQALKLPED